MKPWVRALKQRTFGASKYSQSYQDELLETIFSHVGPGNSPPFCVEFGFSSHRLTGGTGANVARLIVEQQWRSRLFDRNHENPAINLHRERLDAGNIGAVFRRHGVPPQPDYVSIDVDSTDLWLFEALLREFPARDIVGFVKNTPGQHVTEAWDLLRRLAEAGGTLATETGQVAQGRQRGSRKALADLLRRFFGIKDLPFAENRRGKVWSAKFGVRVIS